MDMVVQRDILETARNDGQKEGAETKALEIAQKMHSQGMDIETITALTGLNPEEINRAIARCTGET
jgi:predicted transposase/invertase (TIGR01784 family)